jgi:hypothetical protein
MKARIFTISLLFLFLNACTSIKELADQGRYDEAIKKGAKKLRGKDLKDPKIVALIENAFNKANEKDLNLIKSLSVSNDWRNNEKVLRINQNIAARQNLIKAFLPLNDANGYSAHFNLINTNQINELTTKHIVADLYQEANSLMEQSKKADHKIARKAYTLYDKIEHYQADFENIQLLKSQAYEQGQSHVFVDFVNRSIGFVPKDVRKRFIEYINLTNDSKWVSYHFDQESKNKADYRIELALNDIKISPESLNDTYHHFTKEIQDGFNYKLDKKGNVMKDSSGNDIKIPKFISVKATIREVNQLKEALVNAHIRLIENNTGQVLENSPVNACSTFTNYAVMFQGDKRAVPNEWICKVGGIVQGFPNDYDILDQAIAEVGKKASKNLRYLEEKM